MIDHDQPEPTSAELVTGKQPLVQYVLPWVVLVLLVIIAGMGVVMNRISDNVDEVDVKIDDLDASVSHLEEFVEELEAGPTDEELEQEAAISRAVQLVPEIKEILCGEFPDAQACQGGNPP